MNGRLLPELFVILPGGLLRLMKYGFMMKLQTPVADVKCKTGISYSDKIMMLGSCFTDSIGELLGSYGFDVCRNPFGTLYNPLSIAASVERLVSGRSFTSEDVVQVPGCFAHSAMGLFPRGVRRRNSCMTPMKDLPGLPHFSAHAIKS